MEIRIKKEYHSENLWALIDQSQWSKDKDYKRIQKIFSKLPFLTKLELRGFVNDKIEALEDKYGKKIQYLGDDSWWDLRADVVGRGKEFYNSITFDQLQKMALEVDYKENFEYSFQNIFNDLEEEQMMVFQDLFIKVYKQIGEKLKNENLHTHTLLKNLGKEINNLIISDF